MTYSVVARDTDGRLGIAVQSHTHAVGAKVVFASGGIGAVVTQSYAKPVYGLRGLRMLESGRAPAEVLAELVAADAHHSRAQVAIVDRLGRSAAHTGERCISVARHAAQEGMSFQANMCAPGVVPAMRATYERAAGDFAHRLLAVLRAGEAAGGDLRGRQSASMLIVAAEPNQHPLVDLRVDDHTDPVGELARLDTMRRNEQRMFDAFDKAGSGRLDEAIDDLDDVASAYGDNQEPAIWAIVLLARYGQGEQARQRLTTRIRDHRHWMRFLESVPATRRLRAEPGTGGRP